MLTRTTASADRDNSQCWLGQHPMLTGTMANADWDNSQCWQGQWPMLTDDNRQVNADRDNSQCWQGQQPVMTQTTANADRDNSKCWQGKQPIMTGTPPNADRDNSQCCQEQQLMLTGTTANDKDNSQCWQGQQPMLTGTTANADRDNSQGWQGQKPMMTGTTGTTLWKFHLRTAQPYHHRIHSYLTLCTLGYFACFFFCRLWIFSLLFFFFFFLIKLYKKSFGIYHQSVKQFGSRSGPMFCRAWSGSKLFAKVISRRQKSPRAWKELTHINGRTNMMSKINLALFE